MVIYYQGTTCIVGRKPNKTDFIFMMSVQQAAQNHINEGRPISYKGEE